MVDKNNPAGRLYSLLRDASAQPGKQPARVVWAKVLNADAKSDSDITRKIIALFQLSEEVQNIIRVIEDVNTDLYLSSFPQVEKAFFPLNLGASWSTYQQHLDKGVMTSLQFCAELLSTKYVEEKISDEDLEQITGMINELFQVIADSSLDSALRMTLLEEVERLRTALVMYQIKGAKGLKQSLQATIGMVVANQEELSVAAQSHSDVIDRLGQLIDKIDMFTAKALKVHKALTKPVRFLLELISKDSDASEESTPVTGELVEDE
ncbi:TPA: hypothetical protein NKR26_002434 [Vibrio parahaemolyticus]|nr:hypothetical protein [Vibrio parahaemolyticus]